MVSGFRRVQAFATVAENDVTLEVQQAHPKGLVRSHVGTLDGFLERAETVALSSLIDRPFVMGVRFLVGGHGKLGGYNLLGIGGPKVIRSFASGSRIGSGHLCRVSAWVGGLAYLVRPGQSERKMTRSGP